MKQETRAKYLSLGEHVLSEARKANGGVEPGSAQVRQWLMERASTTTPAYWRRLRTGYALVAGDRWGERADAEVRKWRNPVTRPKMRKSELPEGARGRPKAKKITEGQLERLRTKASVQVGSLMDLVMHTGCRPVEACTMTVDDQNRVRIRGAKGTDKGDRGADRVMQLGVKEAFVVRLALERLHERAAELDRPIEQHVDNQRRNFRALVDRVMPRTKVKPGLKTLRHQFGSELKGAVGRGEMTLEQAAYMMGHQGTESISRYGSSRSATGRELPAPVASERELLHVRDTAREPVAAMRQERTVGRSRERNGSSGYELG